jgi:hypothetical protein
VRLRGHRDQLRLIDPVIHIAVNELSKDVGVVDTAGGLSRLVPVPAS